MAFKPFTAASVKKDPLDLPSGKPDKAAAPEPKAPKKPAVPKEITRAGGMARVRVGG